MDNRRKEDVEFGLGMFIVSYPLQTHPAGKLTHSWELLFKASDTQQSHTQEPISAGCVSPSTLHPGGDVCPNSSSESCSGEPAHPCSRAQLSPGCRALSWALGAHTEPPALN